jgi:hypothetical protein
MLVMQGYKANAKNTNIGVSVGVGDSFNLGSGRQAKAKKAPSLIGNEDT